MASGSRRDRPPCEAMLPISRKSGTTDGSYRVAAVGEVLEISSSAGPSPTRRCSRSSCPPASPRRCGCRTAKAVTRSSRRRGIDRHAAHCHPLRCDAAALSGGVQAGERQQQRKPNLAWWDHQRPAEGSCRSPELAASTAPTKLRQAIVAATASTSEAMRSSVRRTPTEALAVKEVDDALLVHPRVGRARPRSRARRPSAPSRRRRAPGHRTTSARPRCTDSA